MTSRGVLRICLLALCIVLFQATRILAGTTGALTGTILLNDGTPLAGAKVTVTSPSESVSTTTDATGHFGFVSLTPDTYTVIVSKDGYDSVSQAGITVFADNSQTISLSTQKTVKILGTVPVHAAAELVKPGTTADVYSVNTTVQGKVTALGGGGAQDSAYSAIASIPGAYVPPGSSGWYQTVLIRGGDYDQVGYEFDGVPINRSFDNYPTSGAGTLGQQELQVYTGAAPANAESQGLAGFINQVIKTGTYPGFANLDVALGSPGLYNKLDLEAGGATPNRNFSYYLGVGGYAYGQRYYDQHDGASLDPTWGTIFAQSACPGDATSLNFSGCYASGTGPGGYQLGPFVAVSTGTIQDRENVVNLHFGIPHHNDAGKDDIQLLYQTFYLRNPYQNSLLDWGASTFAQAGLPDPQFLGGGIYNGPLGAAVPNLCPAPCNIVPYSFPSSGVGQPAPGARFFGSIPAGQQDSAENGQGIGKIQFQHNIGSNAYFRIYGYSYYSWWYLHGPNSAYLAFLPNGFGAECCPGDYELFTHTRGVSAAFADQITPQHLLNLEVSGITATSTRDNNSAFANFSSGSRRRFAVRVDSTNPLSGICYDATNVATTCSTDIVAADFLRLDHVQRDGVLTDLTGQTCGAGPCEYLAIGNGDVSTYNSVKPTFTAASLTDSWKPTDRLVLNVGLRVDRYQFKGADTTGTAARAFWFNAFNQDNCVSAAPGSTPVDKTTLTNQTTLLPMLVTDPCSAANTAGTTYVSPNLQNVSSPVFTYTDTQPRIGGTYTLDANNVIRFNYGKYSQAPNAAFEQYNTGEQNLPRFLGARFYKYGFTTPGHQVPPEDSYNSDLSFEHHFPNTDTSLKLTPFYRKTKGQFQTFYLDQATAFISGLPAGNLTAEGIELQLAKGDFNRNGLSAILSYAYTHAYINYYSLSNGGTVLSPVNNLIKQYNGYTQFCATNPTASNCGATTNGLPAAPCYLPSGAPDPACLAGSIANPYWLAPAQPLLDEFAKYPEYSLIPNGFEQSVGSNDVPHVLTLVLNYKHDKWAFTPIFALHSGNAYGAPLETSGIDPASGCTALPSGSTTGDPRYPYGAAGGSPYDAMTCPGTLAGGIPNPFTHSFDSLGAFRGPSQLQAHLGISYAATPRTTFSVNLVNLVNTCFGGTSEPWTNQPNVTKNRVCSYVLPAGIGVNSVGNVYNPGATFQQQVQYPYMPSFGSFSPNGGGTSQSFAATFEMKMKL